MSDQHTKREDLGEIVNYEGLYTIEIQDPRDDKPIGVSVTLRSAGSEKAKRVLKNHQKDRLERVQRGKMIVDVDKLERQAEEQVAACIESWNWGRNTYKSETPENNMKWYLRVLSEQPWFFHQCKEGSEKVENFPGNSATN
jgi:hypothetical protein